MNLLIAFSFPLLVLAGVPATPPQPADAEVRQVVAQAIDGLAARDTATLGAVFDPSARLLLVSYQDPSNPSLLSIPIRDIVAQLATPGPRRREQLRNERVYVSSDLATVTAEYVFYMGDVLHHCGDAMYDLAHVQNRWRIVQIRQTDHRQGCPK